jgi:Rod binding domain-containing protein
MRIETQSGVNNATDKKLLRAAQDLEAVFAQQLLNAMDKTIDRENSLLGGGHAESMFRGMLNEHIAQSWARRPGGSGIGLSDVIYTQLQPTVSSPNTPSSVPQ